jgi:holliday junction resolvase YEN1
LYWIAFGRSDRNIPVSIWINQADSVFGVPGHHYQAGENPELNNFFQRLVRLRGLPAVFVFVFDGTDRPLEKNRGRASSTPHALAASLREMIDAFGFYTFQVSATGSLVLNLSLMLCNRP